MTLHERQTVSCSTSIWDRLRLTKIDKKTEKIFFLQIKYLLQNLLIQSWCETPRVVRSNNLLWLALWIMFSQFHLDFDRGTKWLILYNSGILSNKTLRVNSHMLFLDEIIRPFWQSFFLILVFTTKLSPFLNDIFIWNGWERILPKSKLTPFW